MPEGNTEKPVTKEAEPKPQEQQRGVPNGLSLIDLVSTNQIQRPVSGDIVSGQLHTSVLESGVHAVSSRVFSNKETQKTVDHYGTEFVKAAALFGRGWAGVIGTGVIFGLSQASTETSAEEFAADFALGAVKGLGTKGILHAATTKLQSAPLKGVSTGMGFRALDAVVNRDTFTNPSHTWDRLKSEVINPKVMAFDAVTWTMGEGVLGLGNAITKGALKKSPVVGTFSTGASFGMVNGSASEIVRQEQEGEDFSFSKAMKQGLIRAGIDGTAAITGAKLTEPGLYSRMGKNIKQMVSRTPEPTSLKLPTYRLIDLTAVDRTEYPTQKDFADQIPTVKDNVGEVVKPGEAIKPGEVPKPGEAGKPEATVHVNTTGQERVGIMSTGREPAVTGELKVDPRVDPRSGDALGNKGGEPQGNEHAGEAKAGDALSRLDMLRQLGSKAQAPEKYVEVDPKDTQKDLTPPEPPKPREFVISSGQNALDAFRQKQGTGAFLKVKELLKQADGSTQLGPEQNLFVQMMGRHGTKFADEGKTADIIATSHPEVLEQGVKSKHVFPEAQGKVWMVLGDNNRLLISAGDNPIRELRQAGYKDSFRLDAGQTTITVMAPLLVGDPRNMHSEWSQREWAEFDRQLIEAKKLGIDGVSTDVWWGLVEPTKGKFEWAYYDKLAEHITKAGLKWVPILSFHQCGGNVGDNVNQPIPEWTWGDIKSKTPTKHDNAGMSKSEQGNYSKEYIEVHADDVAIHYYESVMREFQKHYKDRAHQIGEINISLGPAGELRYPSYNSHDKNTGYPTRGAFQAYSENAKESFRDFAIKKYGGLDGLRKAWGLESLQRNDINPPSDAEGFLQRGDHFKLQYGRDFIDWYNQSLIDHGARVMSKALEVFGDRNAPFSGIDLGAKVPGVHWRAGEKFGDYVQLGDRLAEITAGLIRTSRSDWNSDADGRGYRPILAMFREINPYTGEGSRVVPSFTCLEIPDGDNGAAIRALPQSLAKWVGQEAHRQGLWLRAENALAGNLGSNHSWDLMKSHLDLPSNDGAYHGVTLLRIGDVVNNGIARNRVAEIMNEMNSKPTVSTKILRFFRLRAS